MKTVFDQRTGSLLLSATTLREWVIVELGFCAKLIELEHLSQTERRELYCRRVLIGLYLDQTN